MKEEPEKKLVDLQHAQFLQFVIANFIFVIASDNNIISIDN